MGDEFTLKFFNPMIFNPFLAEVETHVVFRLLSLWTKSLSTTHLRERYQGLLSCGGFHPGVQGGVI